MQLKNPLVPVDGLCFNCVMDDAKLIDELQQKVREAEETLRRRKEALAALKGKTRSARTRKRGLRPGSIPALAQAALKSTKQPVSLDDLTTHLKKTKSSLDARKVSIALSRYVRLGQYFVVTEDGKYGLK
jgi:hypothetical protein